MLPVMPASRSQARLFCVELHACSSASMYWIPPLPYPVEGSTRVAYVMAASFSTSTSTPDISDTFSGV